MISIAMATYNGEKYLKEQIDSILSQTIQDFELIICDDCSKDSTQQILLDYTKKDKRLKPYFNDKNLGFVQNFEKAISLCTGQYIAICDQDDVWLPNHLEVLFNDIQKYDCNLVCGNSYLMNKNGDVLQKSFSDSLDYFTFNKETIIYRVLCYCNIFCGHDLMIKAKAIKKYLPIPKACSSHDFWFGICAIIESSAYYDFTKITNYRIHENNVTNPMEQSAKKNILQKFKDVKKRFNKAVNRFDIFDELQQREFFTNNNLEIQHQYLECLDYLYPFYYGKRKFKSVRSFIRNNKYFLPPNTSFLTKVKEVLLIFLQ